jgi:saccharopine dehydrogenase-like NADP-dependent oxidoreductase
MKTHDVLVLGGGMIGSAVAFDLARSGRARVTIADLREPALPLVRGRSDIAVRRVDLSDPDAVRTLAEGFDVAVGALPSVLGHAALRAVIEAGTNVVDISFTAENALVLDGLARERGVTAVVDCGVAPGVSNLMVGRAVAELAVVDDVEIFVGGLPRERRWPFDYKAGFAPSDVIEEYVRPARMVEQGRVVTKEALSEPELLDFPGVGTLEAFNTDGLRSLLFTIKAPSMREKTLRYPGHVALMRAFRETGFFSKDLIDVGGQRVRPLDATAALLFPKWTFAEGEADLTVMRVAVRGRDASGRGRRFVFDLLDHYDQETRLRSMSRTTAFPAAIVAGLVADGAFRRPGVHPPEVLGALPGLLETVLSELARRGVRCLARVEEEHAIAAVATA